MFDSNDSSASSFTTAKVSESFGPPASANTAAATAQGIPETGTVTTMDRDGKAQTYTIAQWQDALQDEGEAKAEADAMSTPEPDEPRDLELEANYTKLAQYNLREWERVITSSSANSSTNASRSNPQHRSSSTRARAGF